MSVHIAPFQFLFFLIFEHFCLSKKLLIRHELTRLKSCFSYVYNGQAMALFSQLAIQVALSEMTL